MGKIKVFFVFVSILCTMVSCACVFVCLYVDHWMTLNKKSFGIKKLSYRNHHNHHDTLLHDERSGKTYRQGKIVFNINHTVRLTRSDHQNTIDDIILNLEHAHLIK